MSSTDRRPAGIDRERLINSNLSLARAVARRYAGRGAELDDLVQVGALGLIKAADHFDPDRGVAFKTFAMPRIEGEIRHHLRDKTASLRIPRELQRMGGELRRRHGELAAELGRSPTVSELAGALGTDESEVERALEAERAREAIPISEDPVSETTSSERLDISEDRLLLADSVRTLDDRERQIVYLRFHADLTERQIAHELGISQAHVSRLLSGVLTKLRHELGDRGDGEAAGDITRKGVISREGEPETTADQSEADAAKSLASAGDKAAGGKLAPVGAQQSVAKHLEVRYHVDVKPERNGDRESWTASVEGLPDCSARGATAEEAVERLQPVMESWLSTTLAEARGTPEPNTDEPSADIAKRKQNSSHSGRFLVRMPRELHQQLAQAAERKHVSLNRFVTDALAASVERPAQTTTTTQPQADASPAPSPGRSLRIALAANLVVVVIAALLAVALLVLALERGI